MSISVIIPVYNVSAYLRAGLDSLLAQTVKDWTAVCVDDGSTDGSGAILDEYAARDARIKVVHQTNGGPSSARNAGIEASKGEIVLFMDPDDLVSHDWMARLISGIDGVDFAWGGFALESAGLIETRLSHDVGETYIEEHVKDRVWRAVFGYQFRDLFKVFLPGGLWKSCRRELAGLWCRAFRRSVLGDLRFDESVWLYEDSIFLAEYALRAKSMRVIGDTGYRYSIRPSGMMTSEARERMIQHRFELRDARARIDPKKTAWRGSYVLAALDVLRRGGLRLFWRFVSGKPCA